MRVLLAEELGENCITIEQGRQLYDRILPRLQAGEKVQLDFQGVEVFASPFFNAAIGRLVKDIPTDALNERLAVEHLSPDGLLVLRRVIANSKEYYLNPEARKALDRILAEQPDE